jgi:hypothetical protein
MRLVSRRSPILLLVVVVVASLAFAGSASAAFTLFKTTIFVSEKFPAFHGKLHSKNDFCVADRPVKVYRERPGPDKHLGTDRSEESGFWQVSIGDRLISGSYYAKAADFGSASLGIGCSPVKSKVVFVD